MHHHANVDRSVFAVKCDRILGHGPSWASVPNATSPKCSWDVMCSMADTGRGTAQGYLQLE